MKKSDLNWQLAANTFDVYVLDPFNAVKRVHSPLTPSLSPFEQTPPSQGGRGVLHLRASAEGLNYDGIVVAYLYSTHDGRFFDRDKDGFWNEQKFKYTPNSPSLKDGRCHSTYPQMPNFGNLLCHHLIAHAWLGARPKGKVCDHLDTDLLNWTADNLEGITVPENNRRARIARRLRKAGINPRLLTSKLLRRIFNLPEHRILRFFDLFAYFCANDTSELSIQAIRRNVAKALNQIRKAQKELDKIFRNH